MRAFASLSRPFGRRLRNLLRHAVPLSVASLLAIAIGLAVSLRAPQVMERLRNIAFDRYQQQSPRIYDPDLPVRIVTIDDASLARIGQWPWPRARLAELTRQLHAAGAAAVVFDFVFSETDRMAPDAIAATLPDGPGRKQLRSALRVLPDGDAAFADALAGGPSVVGAVLGGMGRSAGLPSKAGFAFAGDDPAMFLPHYDSVLAPLERFSAAAAGLGALNWVPARDQVVREVPLLFDLETAGLVPGLGVEALRVAQGAGTYVIRASNASGQTALGAQTGLNALRVGAFEVPTTPTGALILHFTRADPARRLPAWEVLAGVADPRQIAGRIILVGATAPGLFDLQATPVDVAVPGIDIHAQVIEHIVTGIGLQRPDWALGAERALLVILICAFGIAAGIFTPLTTAMIGLATLTAVFSGSYAAFARAGLLLDPTFPAIGSAISLFVVTSWVAIRERAARRWVRGAFGRYVSGDLVKALEADPGRLVLGGELREMSILFSDIRGFTTRAEGMDPQAVTAYVNDFLTAMTEVIAARQGTVDKYMGDAIMAFWNAPLDDAEHARNACASALEMTARIATFNQTHAGQYPATEIGIGINTGTCCVGNLGSQQRFDYSVIGDEVNVAARLESATKTFGVSILTGAGTAQDARPHGYIFAPVGPIQVKGKDTRIEVFALLGGPGHPVPEEAAQAMPALAALAETAETGTPNEFAAAIQTARDTCAPRFTRLIDSYETRRAEAG